MHRVVIFADPQFHLAHWPSWEAMCKFVDEVQPSLIVSLGDTCNFEALWEGDTSTDDPWLPSQQIDMAAEQYSRLAKVAPLYVLYGNHDERLEKTVKRGNKMALSGLRTGDFESEFNASPNRQPDLRIRFIRESAKSPGLVIGKDALLARHGHKALPSSTKYVAASLLDQTRRISTICGHYHRGQLQAYRDFGHTVYGISCPGMAAGMDYSPMGSYDTGFVVCEFYGRSRLRECVSFTPHLIFTDNEGRFSYGGKQYGP